MKLGENIYKYRIRDGFSQGDLADALEVSRQSVSKWENSSATPELDKLIKMSNLFNISLDELVYGESHGNDASAASKEVPLARFYMPVRMWVGAAMLLFGMISFLLSLFWGEHLRFGEEIGELVSLCIVLLSIALLGTYKQGVLAGCAMIYMLYSITCVLLNVRDAANNFFIFISGFVILIWFIVQGLRLSGEKAPK